MTDPGGTLGAIAAQKRTDVALRFDGVPLQALRQQAEPTRRSLVEALARPGARFILEIKKESPSEGVIRQGADTASLARGYAGVADALSVLTDGHFFGGALSDIADARREFDGPILAKDFFLDRRQVLEARIAGADAVLVMLSLLADRDARAIIDEAHRFGMEALVEVHDEVEMRRALGLGAPLIGINNRDLKDLAIDLATTERLARLAPGRLLVSESGICDRSDVERLSNHVDAFLVGTALMRSDDPAEAARALIFGRVKLCGVKCAQDLKAGRAATHAGLIFVPGTPRAVDISDALRLTGLGPKLVGVFRNAPPGSVADIARMLGLAAVQLHGDEDSAYCRSLARQLLPTCEIWKAVAVTGVAPGHCDAADRLLFDNGGGGSGRTFDWSLIKDHPDLHRALIAGGIGPANVCEAMRLGAFSVDVGSAVDSVPGMKSPAKIAALFEALRPAARQEVRQCA